MILDDPRTELLVYATDDSGLTWRGPAVLGRSQVGFRDKPAMAYGPGGALGVVWKSVDPKHAYRFDVWAAVSPGGNTNFGRPVMLGNQTSQQQPCGIGMQGQAYTCDELSWMVMDHRFLHAVWGGAPGGKEAPWYGRYDFAADPQFG